MTSERISIIEGTVKFRDGKKWKSRWCVMRKLSPVADCVHLQLYRDAKERQKNGQTKASLSLRHFLGLESGFTLDKESNTLAILCRDVSPVLAFSGAETLLQWRTRAARALGPSDSRVFPALLTGSPSSAKAERGPVRLHVSPNTARLCLTSGLPPRVMASWDVADLRRYGLADGRVCFEVGARGGRTEGAWALLADRGERLVESIAAAAAGIHQAGDQTRKPKLRRERRLDDDSDQMSEADGSIGLGDSASVMDVQMSKDARQIGRCVSCVSRLGARSSPAAGYKNNSWSGEAPLDTDRASLYSQSSGGTSDYSVPRSVCRDPAFRRSSPVFPMPSPNACSCNSPRLKLFNGPYDNYDVPRTPLPLIHEDPCRKLNFNSNYDIPKNIKLCLKSPDSECTCLVNSNRPRVAESPQKNSSYVKPIFEADDECISITDLSATLKEFENSFDILRSAGFSQNEIEGLEDIPENETITNYDNKSNDNDSVKSQPDEPYLCAKQRSNTLDRNVRLRNSEFGLTLKSKRKSSSAEFLKRAEEFFDITKCNSNKDVSTEPMKENAKVLEGFNPIIPEKTNKSETTFLAKFKDSVKIRRSSSVPTKSVKNRDSSSSSDSGISTGSLKYKYDESNLPINKNKLLRKNATAYSLVTADPDPMQQISFQFHDMKSELSDFGGVVKRPKVYLSNDGRFVRSPSSCGSETSDYFETLSISSVSSGDTCNRSTIRPRSGREYSTIQPALRLQATCQQCCQASDEL